MLNTSGDTICDVLLISSDCAMNQLLNEYLNNPHINLKCSVVTEHAIVDDIFLKTTPDLVILDLDNLGDRARMMITRITSCMKLTNVPKIVTAKNDNVEIKIHAFEMGVDEFVLKPIIIHELIARVKNIFKKYKKFIGEKIIQVEDIVMNLINHTVTVANKRVNVSSKEFGILRLFVENAKRIFSREEILYAVWKNPIHITKRTVDVHINRLRAAIGKNSNGKSYIKTVRNAGYGIDLITSDDDFDDYNNSQISDYNYDFFSTDNLNFVSSD